MVRRVAPFAFAAVLGLVSHPVAQSTPPDVAALQKLAREYVEGYGPKVSGVALDELLMLLNTSGAERRVPSRLACDLVLVKFEDRLLGLRDPYAIDTRKLRDHQLRIIQALSDPTQANVDRAQQYVRENAGYLQHNVVVWYTDPVMALQYVAKVHEDKLIYKVEGDKTINGVKTYGLGFKERPGAARVLSMIPGDAESWGRLWVDPETGEVHMTELWVQSKTDVVRVRVNFERDAKLGWLLPRRASHNLEWREMGNMTSTVGRAPMKLSFESNSEYTKATYTKIDLAKGH